MLKLFNLYILNSKNSSSNYLTIDRAKQDLAVSGRPFGISFMCLFGCTTHDYGQQHRLIVMTCSLLFLGQAVHLYGVSIFYFNPLNQLRKMAVAPYISKAFFQSQFAVSRIIEKLILFAKEANLMFYKIVTFNVFVSLTARPQASNLLIAVDVL